jgi:hypothetical protein
MQKECEEECTAEGSVRNLHSPLWKEIWKLNLPNVEKHFIWRACHDILPTRENLFRRKVLMKQDCPLCELEAETTCHFLWSCPSTRDVWGGRE